MRTLRTFIRNKKGIYLDLSKYRTKQKQNPMIFAPFTAWKRTINNLVNLLSLLGRPHIIEPLLRKIVAFSTREKVNYNIYMYNCNRSSRLIFSFKTILEISVPLKKTHATVICKHGWKCCQMHSYMYTCIYECQLNIKRDIEYIREWLSNFLYDFTFSDPQHGLVARTILDMSQINLKTFFPGIFSPKCFDFFQFLWSIRTCTLVYVRLLCSPEPKAKVLPLFQQHLWLKGIP